MRKPEICEYGPIWVTEMTEVKHRSRQASRRRGGWISKGDSKKIFPIMIPLAESVEAFYEYRKISCPDGLR